MFGVICLMNFNIMSDRVCSTHFFHLKPQCYNCAQSVLMGFQHQFNLPESLITDFKNYGGGKAPNGICGALYAANYLLSLRNLPPVSKEFSLRVGASTCKQIKGETHTLCLDCVQMADSLVESHL